MGVLMITARPFGVSITALLFCKGSRRILSSRSVIGTAPPVTKEGLRPTALLLQAHGLCLEAHGTSWLLTSWAYNLNHNRANSYTRPVRETISRVISPVTSGD